MFTLIFFFQSKLLLIEAFLDKKNIKDCVLWSQELNLATFFNGLFNLIKDLSFERYTSVYKYTFFVRLFRLIRRKSS